LGREIILVLAVIDFWLVKNVIGRKILGVRWFFEAD